MKTKAEPPSYTLREEIANSITHGIGALLSALGTGILLYLATQYGTAIHLASFSIYGTCLVLLHLASTLYHGIQAPRAKRVLWVIDHSSIYLLIAGTYTPFLLLSLRDRLGMALLATVWALAAIGIAFKSIFIGRLRRLSVAYYVLMGWLIVIAARQIWLKVPHPALVYVAGGGLSYTFGIVFYGWKKLPYNHAIWHLFVLGGSISHYFAVLFYLVPRP